MQVKVSSPGKIHLIGEHAVVYGKPAILAAVDLRCHVTASPDESVRIFLRDYNRKAEFETMETLEFADKLRGLWSAGMEKSDFSGLFSLIKKDRLNPVKAMAGLALEAFGLENGISLGIKSGIPAGAGMGSSASLAVSLSRAIAEANGITLTRERNNEIAFSMEQIMHGNPSGGDNAACCYGGAMWFVKGSPPAIEKIDIAGMAKAIIVNTGEPKKTTGEMVSMIRGLEEGYRTPRVEELGRLAKKMREALASGNAEQTGKIIDRTQALLAELGVSTSEIDALAGDVRKAGGHAKLCGAGGGGIVLCLHKDMWVLKKILFDYAYEWWECTLGAEGVRIESSNK